MKYDLLAVVGYKLPSPSAGGRGLKLEKSGARSTLTGVALRGRAWIEINV